jgi:hypothetical protein
MYLIFLRDSGTTRIQVAEIGRTPLQVVSEGSKGRARRRCGRCHMLEVFLRTEAGGASSVFLESARPSNDCRRPIAAPSPYCLSSDRGHTEGRQGKTIRRR